MSERYRVEPTGKGFWPYCVRAGNGTRDLYVGHKKTCDRVAAELTTAFRDGEFVGKGLYDALAAETQALREEVAALRARVVVPDGYALVPVEPNDEMLSAGCVADNAMHSNLSNRDNKHRCYQSMLNAAPPINGKAVSEGLLRRLARPAHRYDEVFTVDRHEAAEELRALLGEEHE
ncbi:hypothetical protein [Pseudomonas aeruginosa]|uniref:hypothetical protein n=1 Tax=Pseudomonas aeruginosa TaxID=287 RepID=UPI00259CAD7A|nr:hypothetical protein [Pseudomonas aeruginosa]EKV0392716.1 hypothetical protein [Pseudomonas aeruginosa]EKV3011487.1 hypothetical protein [Pseudomonas aeruginosa]EKX2272307.1 hypothetical protein [Pseudomonas aeruginosa]MDM4786325.1 hypothetical protein [Pseudomonas aeruginosa]MDM4842282.1 hypothetical protein [Pseudomonas aeruginosa]